jgi:hypothetical protein
MSILVIFFSASRILALSPAKIFSASFLAIGAASAAVKVLNSVVATAGAAGVVVVGTF